MNKKEDNSFQLLFTALVLVVIAVGGTLAWFAHNTTSSVDQMGASVTAPTENDSFDGRTIEEWNGTSFATYGEGQGMCVPDMLRLFRVEVNAQTQNKVLFIVDEDSLPTLGGAIKIKFFDSDPTIANSAVYWKDSGNLPTQTINSLAHNYQYTSRTVVHNVPLGQYVWFSLYMDPAAELDPYEGTSFDFIVGVGDPGEQINN